jgi:hypothetical protein
MAFNIQNFVNGGLRYGGARPTLFDVDIQFPAGLNVNGEIRRKLQFTARATSIPASTVASVDVPYFGRTIKVAGDRSFADWSITVMNDEDYSVRSAFEAWHNAINSIVGNKRELRVELPGQDSYKQTAVVRHFPKSGDSIMRAYSFFNIFPVQVDEMALDWEAQNQIQTFGVTFAYDYWIPLVGSSVFPAQVDIATGATPGSVPPVE